MDVDKATMSLTMVGVHKLTLILHSGADVFW